MMKFTFAAETKTAADPHEHVLTYGKHKGASLGELARTWPGRNYLRYLSGIKADSEEGHLLQRVLEGTPEVECTAEDAGNTVLHFGKHRGTTLRDVVSKDKGAIEYFKWVLGWDKCPTEITEAVTVILEEYNKQRESRGSQ
jgi:hypothetical protein